jgi:hypothetical protein
LDIRPISDPSAVTQMQKMAKAQFSKARWARLRLSDVEDIDFHRRNRSRRSNADCVTSGRRVLEAADIEGHRAQSCCRRRSRSRPPTRSDADPIGFGRRP